MRLLRSILAIAFLSLLAACADDSSDYSRFGRLVYNQFGGDSGVSRDKAGAVPYATLGVNIGGGTQGMVVLATAMGRDRLWLAGTDLAISTRDGRIVQTSGMPHNLNGVSLLSEDGANSTYKYDLANPAQYGVLVHCQRQDLGEEQVEILGSQIDTRHTSENCEASEIGWSFTNEFWRDPKSGYVWKSVQYIHPKEDELHIEVFRPEDVQ